MQNTTIVTLALLLLQACGKDSDPANVPNRNTTVVPYRDNYIRSLVLLTAKPIDKASDTTENEVVTVDVFTERDGRFKFTNPGSGTSTINYQLTTPPIDTSKPIQLLEPAGEYINVVVQFGNKISTDSIAFTGTLKPGRDYTWIISSSTSIYGTWKYVPGASRIPAIGDWYNRQLRRLTGKGFTVIYN